MFNVYNEDLLDIFECGDMCDVCYAICRSKLKRDETVKVSNQFIQYLKDNGYIKRIVYGVLRK